MSTAAQLGHGGSDGPGGTQFQTKMALLGFPIVVQVLQIDLFTFLQKIQSFVLPTYL